MSRDVQKTIVVTSLRGRCHFDEFLKVLLQVFSLKMKEYAFTSAFLLNNNICLYFRKILFILALGMGVSDIKSTQILLEKRQNSTMWKSLNR